MGNEATVVDWAHGVIAGVSGFNKAYKYRRKIRSQEQLATDFGTGANNGDGLAILKGWMVHLKNMLPDVMQGGACEIDYDLEYHCIWSVEDSGANATTFRAHVKAAANALMATARPASLVDLTLSKNEIVYPVSVSDIYEIRFAVDGGRLCWRADLTQTVRLREQIRS